MGFEDAMGWSGALIEPTPPSFKKLQESRGNGNNSLFGEAVCADGVGHLEFNVGDTPATNSVAGTMSDDWVQHWQHGGEVQVVKVPCRPLGKMLRTMLQHTGSKHIDLFSLDVEGGELKVLETMDWSVPVKVWLIEINGGRSWTHEELTDVMKSHGYVPSPKGATLKVNNAIGHMVASVPTSKVMDVYNAWAGILS